MAAARWPGPGPGPGGRALGAGSAGPWPVLDGLAAAGLLHANFPYPPPLGLWDAHLVVRGCGRELGIGIVNECVKNKVLAGTLCNEILWTRP